MRGFGRGELGGRAVCVGVRASERATQASAACACARKRLLHSFFYMRSRGASTTHDVMRRRRSAALKADRVGCSACGLIYAWRAGVSLLTRGRTAGAPRPPARTHTYRRKVTARTRPARKKAGRRKQDAAYPSGGAGQGRFIYWGAQPRLNARVRHLVWGAGHTARKSKRAGRHQNRGASARTQPLRCAGK